MLSKILSTLFFAAFGLVVLQCTLKTIADIRNDKLSMPSGKDGEIVFAEPGLLASASRFNSHERNAPDSVITFLATDTAGGTSTTGGFSPGQSSAAAVELFNFHLKAAKEGRGQLVAD